MKKIAILGALLLSNSAFAEMIYDHCEFESENGRPFKFLQNDPDTAFKTRESGPLYLNWVSDRFKRTPILEREFKFRQAKLDTSKFYRRYEQVLPEHMGPSPVRYYRAIAEDCSIIWARIDERDDRFKRYYDSSNHLMTGDTPWNRFEDHLSIQFEDVRSGLKSKVGKTFSVYPNRDRVPFVGKTISQDSSITFKNHEKLKLLKVYPGDFVHNGVRTGSIQLLVERKNGDKVIVPWDPERLKIGSPVMAKGILGTHRIDIAKGDIRFGMSTKEVMTSWGEPDRIRVLPLYEPENGERRFVKDDEYPYGDVFKEYRASVDTMRIPEGKYQEWYYPGRLKAGETLVFDEKGVLLEDEQTRSLHKNSIHEPVALPRK